MDIDQLLRQSLQLLGLGMGSVFIILGLLIAIISIVSKLVPKDLPAPESQTVNPAASVNNQHIAAIQIAIDKFRNSRGR